MRQRQTVLATGAFDLVHLGHIKFLQESKKKGGPGARLVVVIARDSTVLERKGSLPVIPEQARRDIVASLKPVNKAILGHPKFDMLGILREVKPDVVTVGYDQNEIKASLKRLIKRENLRIRVVQIRWFGPGRFNNSSRLKARIAMAFPNKN
jgi:FAD synthetase